MFNWMLIFHVKLWFWFSGIYLRRISGSHLLAFGIALSRFFFFFKSLVQHLLTHKCLVCHSNWSNSNGKNRFKSEKSSSKNVRFHRHRIKTNSKQLKWKKNGIYNGKKSVTYVEHLKQFDVAIKNRHYRVKSWQRLESVRSVYSNMISLSFHSICSDAGEKILIVK